MKLEDMLNDPESSDVVDFIIESVWNFIQLLHRKGLSDDDVLLAVKGLARSISDDENNRSALDHAHFVDSIGKEKP